MVLRLSGNAASGLGFSSLAGGARRVEGLLRYTSVIARMPTLLLFGSVMLVSVLPSGIW